MYYRNTAFSSRTYQGVTFAPGEVKEVRDFINDPKMVLTSAPTVEAKSTKSVKAVSKSIKSTKSAKSAEVSDIVETCVKDASEINKEEINHGKDCNQ